MEGDGGKGQLLGPQPLPNKGIHDASGGTFIHNEMVNNEVLNHDKDL